MQLKCLITVSLITYVRDFLLTQLYHIAKMLREIGPALICSLQKHAHTVHEKELNGYSA